MELYWLSMSSYIFLGLVSGFEIREQGCGSWMGLLGWKQIRSYEWKHTKDQLLLRLKAHDRVIMIETAISVDKQDLVDEVLAKHGVRKVGNGQKVATVRQ
jgi:hypothetical protein